MKPVQVTIRGEVPSKKNQRQLVIAGGRVRSIPSERYTNWHTAALWQLKGVKPYAGSYPVTVSISIYTGSKRRADLDNKASSVLDTLVDAGIIADDDISHVDQLEVLFIDIDKKDPRVMVWIGGAGL
jgi:Holliday junction resolvase RusA-like endonuclease